MVTKIWYLTEHINKTKTDFLRGTVQIFCNYLDSFELGGIFREHDDSEDWDGKPILWNSLDFTADLFHSV